MNLKIHYIGNKANKSNSYKLDNINPKFVHIEKTNIDNSHINLIVGLGGSGKNVFEVNDPKYVCIDSGPFQPFHIGENHIRTILFGSYMYDQVYTSLPASYEKWKRYKSQYKIPDTIYDSYDQLSNKSVLIICAPNSGGFYKHLWTERIQKTVYKAKQNFAGTILIRLHPKDRGRKNILKLMSEWGVQPYHENFTHIKKKLYGVVCFNGSVCVECSILGIPVFCFDNDVNKYLCSKIAFTKLEMLNYKKLYPHLCNKKRVYFLEWISSQTFSCDEISAGLMYNEIYNHLVNNVYYLKVIASDVSLCMKANKCKGVTHDEIKNAMILENLSEIIKYKSTVWFDPYIYIANYPNEIQNYITDGKFDEKVATYTWITVGVPQSLKYNMNDYTYEQSKQIIREFLL